MVKSSMANSQSSARRVKTGCTTCRLRKLKCCEERPRCKRCVESGRACGGFGAFAFTRRELQAAHQRGGQGQPLLATLHDADFTTVLERRYFQWFRLQTVTVSNVKFAKSLEQRLTFLEATNAAIQVPFWDRYVLQACRANTAIKHGALALSAWHQLSVANTTQDERDMSLRFAFSQYDKTLQNVRRTLSVGPGSQDIVIVVTICILCVLFEAAYGDYAASALHLTHGRTLAACHAEVLRRDPRRTEVNQTLQMLGRLHRSTVSLREPLSGLHETYSVEEFECSSPILDAWDFGKVDEARACLFDILRGVHLALSHRALSNGSSEQAKRYRGNCVQRLRSWNAAIQGFGSRNFELPFLILRLWYSVGWVLAHRDPLQPQTEFDIFLDVFKDCVNFSKQIAEHLNSTILSRFRPHFSYESNCVILIYWTATHCRDPGTRREACNVLREMDRREGVYDSLVMAEAAERWIGLEETGLNVEYAHDVPEENRLSASLFSSSTGGGYDIVFYSSRRRSFASEGACAEAATSTHEQVDRSVRATLFDDWLQMTYNHCATMYVPISRPVHQSENFGPQPLALMTDYWWW